MLPARLEFAFLHSWVILCQVVKHPEPRAVTQGGQFYISRLKWGREIFGIYLSRMFLLLGGEVAQLDGSRFKFQALLLAFE